MQGRKQFVVECRQCRRDIPVDANELPFCSIVVACPLCGERHRYLPSEMVLSKIFS